MSGPVVMTSDLTHRYGERVALAELNLSVDAGGIIALLGPNGGGKSTLFRILATLLRPSGGSARVLGFDVTREPAKVRERIGVAFQSPSLDPHLTVRENLMHQGHLYGLRGAHLGTRIDELAKSFALSDRLRERVATLSGGLARRVDLTKVLLHRPPLILLDEPSTGLDPSVRRDLFDLLVRSRDEHGTSVFLTTHLLEEAAACDSVAILDRGKLVAQGPPAELVREIGGEVITLSTDDPHLLTQDVAAHFRIPVEAVPGGVRVERENAAALLPELLGAFPGRVKAATVASPSLSDVFFHRTGRTFREAGDV